MLVPMQTRTLRFLLPTAALILAAALPFSAAQQSGKAQAPKSLRLYILDCGKITGVGEAAFGFQPGQLANTEMFTPCYLIAHPRGTMIWDTGEISDSQFKAPGPATQGAFTVIKPLLPQLAEIGYTPRDITYLALSHYHGDHVANANLFAGSTWIVQKIERDAMFVKPAPGARGGPHPVVYPTLEKNENQMLNSEGRVAFGEGTDVIKLTLRRTSRHHLLFPDAAPTV